MPVNDDIPLTAVRTGSSSTATRKPTGLSSMSFNKLPTIRSDDEKKGGFFSRGPAGRRKVKKVDSNKSSSSRSSEEHSLNTMGKLYYKIINSNPVTRYLVYVLPVAAIIAIPLAIFATIGHDDTIGGVRTFWFVLWLLVVWLGLWVAKVFAKLVPGIFIFLCGVVSSGTRKYAQVIKNLEIPISIIGWAAISFATFEVLTTRPDNDPSGVGGWVNIMKQILAALLISSGIFLAEKIVIQMIGIGYHARSFENRIKESKHNVYLLGLLFDASRTLFPMYCREFQEEDYLITGNLDIIIPEAMKGHSRSGSATPMKLLGEIGRIGDKVTSVFGNIASEIAGKQVFNPNSAHSIVIEALERKKSTEALAKRIWMSFVVEGRDALYPEDLREVLGAGRHEEADEAFTAIDQDNNGDVSLDEMIMTVVEIGRDRKAIANSMNDIGQAISVLDSVLTAIVFVICVLIFVAFLNASFVTTLATAGTTLLSLSFVFAVTAQEFLGSCIFLFVKHPYDVGDRVDIVGPEKENLVVEQISLLYTVFKRIDCMKMVQVPNIVLNTMWIENVSRSKAMKEQLEMFIDFGTTLEDIEILRTEMEKFVRDPENSRDFQPDVVLECTGIGNMDKLQLRVEIRHKSNWSNETVRASRRSKFMCALVLALRKVPIHPPGGGGAPLGDPSNPSYSVAVSDNFAVGARDKAAKEKEEARLVPTKQPTNSSIDTGKSTAVDSGKLGPESENQAIGALNARRPTEDARDDWGSKDSGSRDVSLERVRSRNQDIEDLRQGLLKRESTRGRRRPGVSIPPTAPQLPQPVSATTSRTTNFAAPGFDEEAALGGGMGGRTYAQAPPVLPEPVPAPATYSAFPPPEDSYGQRLQQGSPTPKTQRPRGLSATQQTRRT